MTHTYVRWAGRVFIACFAVLTALHAQAEVKLHSLFSEGMVLQQGVEVPIWGSGRDGEKVTVSIQGQKVSATTKDGRWLVRVKKLKAGGPFTMTVTGDNTLTFTNVLVGEVWLASGQSNMAFTLNRAANGNEVISKANDPQFRFFKVPHESSDEPREDVAASWQECTPRTAADFSAVAYFFGRDLRQTRKVPIGILEASVGGTPAEAWVPRKTLESDPELKKILDHYAAAIQAFDAKVKKGVTPTKRGKAGKPATPEPSPRQTSKRPNGLYNAMIHPLEPYAISGAIWYQGEANAGRAEEYKILFPALIKSWRDVWGKHMPFLFVQIAPYRLMTPEIRDAQLWTMEHVPNTGMAVITDHGEAQNIHPVEKEPVGQRLALAARALAYGEKIEYSGPIFKSMKVKGNEAILSFTHVDGGLVAKGGVLKGFEVSGADHQFTNATARIDGDKVVVSSAAVEKPVAVRFGWARVPEVNFFNQIGLPASPFTTERK